LEVSLNELTNNQSETKAKINTQIKLVRKKSLKTVLRSNALNGPLCFYRLTWTIQKHKINTLLYCLLKELHRSDFLFDGGYVGAKTPLLSTSKIKREKI